MTDVEELAKRGIKYLSIHRTHDIEVIVFDDAHEAAVMKQVERALIAGSSVTYSDGRKVWYDDDWVTKPDTKFEPIWHEDGNRIRKKRIEITQAKDGTITKRQIKEFWGAYLDD